MNTVEPLSDAEMKRLAQWSMNDDEWRAAGCPPPGSLDYALKSAQRLPDAGVTYCRLMATVRDLNK